MAKTTVRRHAERGRYDPVSAYEILDEALICHVAFTDDNDVYNIPMIPVRINCDLYLHTSIKSRFYQVVSGGTKVCVTITLVDGLVLAKSAYNSSMNYRSVMLFGTMLPVIDPVEKVMFSEKLTEKIAKGRWNDCRLPNERELKSTGILKMTIKEFSVKIRSGPPVDESGDLSLPHWSWVIPVMVCHGNPVTSTVDDGKLEPPDYLTPS